MSKLSEPGSKGYLLAKRGFDVTASAVGLVVLAPLFLLIAALIKLSSPGPVFYRGTRIGQYGKPFQMIKFRTMVPDADKMGSTITGRGDPRVTSIGRLLRRTKLDELPELINVLKGDMSFVGPRPETPPWVELYSEEQMKALDVRPGITDPAQILFRHEEEYLEGEDQYVDYMRVRISKQLEYIQVRSFWRDLKAILDTLLILFEKEPSEEALDVYRSIGAMREKKQHGHSKTESYD